MGSSPLLVVVGALRVAVILAAAEVDLLRLREGSLLQAKDHILSAKNPLPERSKPNFLSIQARVTARSGFPDRRSSERTHNKSYRPSSVPWSLGLREGFVGIAAGKRP